MWSHTEQFLMTSLANKKLQTLWFQNKNRYVRLLCNFLDEKGVSYPNAALSPASQSSLTSGHQGGSPAGHRHICKRWTALTVVLWSFLFSHPAGEEKTLHFSATRGSQSTPRALSSHPAVVPARLAQWQRPVPFPRGLTGRVVFAHGGHSFCARACHTPFLSGADRSGCARHQVRPSFLQRQFSFLKSKLSIHMSFFIVEKEQNLHF